jgi:hypothetical protein
VERADVGRDHCGQARIPAPRPRPHRFRAKDQPAKLLLITVPGGIEDYFHQINNATTDGERHRIGEQYSIRVVPE